VGSLRQTIWVFGAMGMAVAWLQLCTFLVRCVWLPLVLVFLWLSMCLQSMVTWRPAATNAPPRRGRSNDSAQRMPLMGLLGREGSHSSTGAITAACLRLSRCYSIDAVFCDLLHRQAQREQGAAAPTNDVFLMVPDAPRVEDVEAPLSAEGALSLIESVSVVIGVDLAVCDVQHDDAPLIPGGVNSPALNQTLKHTVALIMPNSVYYPSIWMGISKASEVVSVVAAASAVSSGLPPARGHTCSAALLNTSITNNSMFSRAIASSGALVVACWLWMPHSSGCCLRITRARWTRTTAAQLDDLAQATRGVPRNAAHSVASARRLLCPFHRP
jgi:hypothetical protein